jgi:hypothetical protein
MNNQPTKVIRSDKSTLLSIIILDWSVREKFFGLHWLNSQDIARDQYEIIWVEIYDRRVPEVEKQVDRLITCGQKRLYHKHKAWNEAVLQCHGEIVTLCDADVVFSTGFVRSILDFFEDGKKRGTESRVLMHHEWRTHAVYPGEGIKDIEELKRFEWMDLWPNAGACMSVQKKDYIRFGGLDEHASFRGYLCGPYDLAWRMVNAGIPEVWHDPEVALWHFAHPDPTASFVRQFSFYRWIEIRRFHIDHHAYKAIEAFSSGRVMPLHENKQIHSLRMERRIIGTVFEEKYANLTGPSGFTLAQKSKLALALMIEPLLHYLNSGHFSLLGMLKRIIGEKNYKSLQNFWHKLKLSR